MGEFWHACLNLMMGSGGALMMLAMILFWIGVVALVVLGARWLLRRGDLSRKDGAEDPLRILERRFAAGEIDREEFEQRRRTLLGSS
jgi:putative membrane protein